jgi:hypothetical protein
MIIPGFGAAPWRHHGRNRSGGHTPESWITRSRFRTDGRIEHLVEQINRRVPYPVGGLHKGSASAPSGGGHWSLVIGGYVRTAIGSGQALRDSERNWGRHWQVEGSGSGWWIQISTHQ